MERMRNTCSQKLLLCRIHSSCLQTARKIIPWRLLSTKLLLVSFVLLMIIFAPSSLFLPSETHLGRINVSPRAVREKLSNYDIDLYKNRPSMVDHVRNEKEDILQLVDDNKIREEDILQLVDDGVNTSCVMSKPTKLLYYRGYWQRYVASGIDIKVISAFYDNRDILGGKRVVRVFTVNMMSSADRFCHLWFSGRPEAYVTQAEVTSMGRGELIQNEDYYMRYEQAMLTCSPPPRSTPPTSVSVTTQSCSTSTIDVDVYDPSVFHKTTYEHEFGVCVAISFGELDYSTFVEWMEFHRMFGVTEFTIYNGTLSIKNKPLFKYYEDRGLLKVHNMPPPVDDLSVKGTKVASPASLNDCMYRNAYRYKHMLVLDFDEFILPTIHKNYSSLIDNLNKKARVKNQYWSYTFQNVYHLLDAGPNERTAETLLTLRYTKRASTSPFPIAAKSMVDPRRCKVVFNHHCFQRFPQTPALGYTIKVPVRLAASHHYRKCGFKAEECESLLADHKDYNHTFVHEAELKRRVQTVLEMINV